MRRHLMMIAALAVLGTAVAAGVASAASPIQTGQGGVDITLPGGQNLPPVGALPQCSDGVDNDGNGLVDMADPGCSSPLDPSESGGTGVTGPTGPTAPPTGPTGPTSPTGGTGPVGVHSGGQGNGGAGGSSASASSGGANGNTSGSFSAAHVGRNKRHARNNSGGASLTNQLPPERKPNGVPTTTNPTTTIASAQPAPLGVPNFVISQFTIPPFLLPIYQACGTEYGIPWQVLASINKIETGFGTNLNVSTAGAVGWMQFLPSTWKTWGVDANGDGRADPYNPVDAICAAARYLKAAGGQSDIRKAVFAYNHASWYVDEVMLYARQYGGVPQSLLGSLTGLTQGDRFPVAATARYADDIVDRQAVQRAKPRQGVTGNVADIVSSSPTRRGINIYSHSGAKVVAVNDGTIKKIGHTKQLGNYVVLEDSYGNRFIYAQLGQLSKVYPVPKQQRLTAADFKLVGPGNDAKPTAPASAGVTPAKVAAAKVATAKAAHAAKSAKAVKSAGKGSAHAVKATPSRARVRAERAAAHSGPTNTEDLRPRLSANAKRAKKAGGSSVGGQLNSLLKKRMLGYHSVKAYLGNVLHFDRKTMALRPLHVGARVPAGTVLGRIGKTTSLAPHLNFSIRPTGKGAPKIDPKPILDGWKLLQDTAIYRAAGTNPFKPHASITQALLASKQQLERQVLSDPRLQIYQCGRNDIQTGQIDQRVLSAMEYFADSGFRLTVTSLKCGSSKKALTKAGAPHGDSSGSSLEISSIDNVPVSSHGGPGSLNTELIKSALNLQGVMTPQEVISNEDLPGPISFTLPSYTDRIHIGFVPLSGAGYQFPFLSFAWGRTDMGVDFTGTGPINAIGNARILQTGAAGWPNGGAGPAGQGVLYKLLDGPKAGHIVYVYEGVQPTVHAGQTVVAGQQIATFYPGGSIEIGWADAAGRPLAAPVYTEGKVTAWGTRFGTFLRSMGGGPGKMSRQFNQLLSAGQWKHLIGRIGTIQQPKVSTEPSQYAIRAAKNGSVKHSTHH